MTRSSHQGRSIDRSGTIQSSRVEAEGHTATRAMSPWPIFGGLAALSATTGGVMYMHSYSGGGFFVSIGLLSIIYTMIVW